MINRMEYYNEISKEIDKYMLYDNRPYSLNTYICHYTNNIWSIRFPGATRGHIIVDDNFIIKSIEFYSSTSFGEAIGCYKEEVTSAVKKFIGTKLVLSESL